MPGREEKFMREELVFVIMSVYNETQDWIKQSVDSMIHQTYTNLQITSVWDTWLDTGRSYKSIYAF